MKRRLAALMLSLCAAALPAHAWPDKTITVVVPYSAGGLTDFVARAVSDEVGRQLGQSVVIDNRPGAGGKIGLDQVRRSPKDGYTLALVVPATMATLPLTDKNFGIKPLQDFAPITIAVDTAVMLVANKQRFSNAKLEDFVATVKAQNGKANYATPGAGTSFHFNSVLLNNKLGLQALHVPYKGEINALNDLVSGVIDYMLAGQGARAYIDAQRLWPIAVTASTRLTPYPDVPTFRELGIDFVTDGWVGFAAPAGVPPEVLERLNTAFVNAIKAPAVRKMLVDAGMVPVGNSPTEFRKIIEEMTVRYSEMLRTGAVKINR